MNAHATKQALAEDIKREILMDLQYSQTPFIYNSLGSKQNNLGRNSIDRNMIESIKKDVLMELEVSQEGSYQPSYRSLVEAVKRDVLAIMQTDLTMNRGGIGSAFPPERALIDAVKRDVIAQLDAQQETQRGLYNPHQHQRQNSYYSEPSQTLVQAVKNSVLAEMQMPEN